MKWSRTVRRRLRKATQSTSGANPVPVDDTWPAVANQVANGEDAIFEVFDCARHVGEAQASSLFDSLTGAWARAQAGMLCITHSEELDPECAGEIQARLASGGAPRLAFTGSLAPAEPATGALGEIVSSRCFYVPPLRDHLGDLAALATHLFELEGQRTSTRFAGLTEDGQRRLAQYAWPANVAELKGLALQLTLLGDGRPVSSLELSRLAPDLFGAPAWGTSSPVQAEQVRTLLSDLLGEDRYAAEAADLRLAQLGEDSRLAAVGALLRTDRIF